MALFDFLKKNKIEQQDITVKETIQGEVQEKESQEKVQEGDVQEENVQNDMQEEEPQEKVQKGDMQEEDVQNDIQEEIPTEEKINFFKKIISSLDKTRKNITSGIENVLNNFKTIDEDLFEELEEALIMADLGVETSTTIINGVKGRVKNQKITEVSEIKNLIIEEISVILDSDSNEFILPSPSVILIIGVNGVGKTTTIGKLTSHYKSEGKKVLLAAGDTFRAAAIDQLEVWGKRSGVEVIKHQENSDPSAVIFDAIQSAKAKKVDLLICDTAGRLHNKKNLMEELKKIFRTISTNYPEANLEVLLVLDSTTGQNALQQAKLFKEVADITGIVLTKLDGTAKGGIVISIKNELKIPVRFIGVGEGISDLRPFKSDEFAAALFNEDNKIL